MKAARRPENPFAKKAPDITDCMYHRCSRHGEVPILNQNEEATFSECGACIAEEMLTTRAQMLYVLDALADRLTYGAQLRRKLEGARDRLNIVSPGAGDYLTEGDDEPE